MRARRTSACPACPRARAALPARRGALAVLAALALAPLLAACGMQRTLTLDSEPSGARVWVDGVDRGTTPVTIPFVHPGAWHVRMEKPGHLAVAQDVSVATRTSDLPVVDLPSEVLGGRRDERRVLRLPPLGGTPDAATLEGLRQRALDFRQRARREVDEPGTPQPRPAGPARSSAPAQPSAPAQGSTPAQPSAPAQGTVPARSTAPASGTGSARGSG